MKAIQNCKEANYSQDYAKPKVIFFEKWKQFKTGNYNTYIGLTMSPGVNNSALVENKYVTKSKGKIDPNNTNSRASAFALIGLDSN